MPISVSNPDLLRHSTELFMDSGFSPLCQRMGAMVAFRRFEEFTRYGVGPVWPCPAPSHPFINTWAQGDPGAGV